MLFTFWMWCALVCVLRRAKDFSVSRSFKNYVFDVNYSIHFSRSFVNFVES